jgi:RNA-directed DNA polymerase
LANQSEHPVAEGLLERILSSENLRAALKQVERNKGSAGVDGMPVTKLREHLKKHWQKLRASILDGTYRPSPALRIEIPKPNGGKRFLGIPTVVDRFIQQAIMQVLQSIWDPTFSEFSYGFRPGRSAHQAIHQAQKFIRQGYCWVADLDIEKFFDNVNHDLLMRRLREKISDRRVLRLINLYLRSGVIVGDVYHETPEGTPQGSPLSPLLANVLLDLLDKELERRGHRFGRYADDCNVYLRSRRSAERVLSSLSRFLLIKLKLKVIRRKLRCYLWKQWGRRGYRELRRRGVSRDLAWNTAKSAHGPWRLSHSPALAIALPGKYFDASGLPRLYVRST